MLNIHVQAGELYDDSTEKFSAVNACELTLEHSLISISKWEKFYKKPFLKEGKKSIEEQLQYIKFMTINKNIDDSVYLILSNSNLLEISAYIDDPMTATTFHEYNRPGLKAKKREILTAEIIYWQMIALGIPWECQKWHLNSLLTLIRVCNIKNDPKAGKMNQVDIAKQMAEINEARKAQLKTKG